jgi:hypothetical protein
MYFVADRTLMAVPVKLAPSFEPGKPVALFELPSADYVPSADGQRFIAVVPVSETAVAPPITVVTNWLAGVGK